MPESIDDTRAMLAKHHRDVEHFADLMKQTYANRFGDAFWTFWHQHVGAQLQRGSHVLDLGTGPGLFIHDVVERYPGVRVTGVDVAPWMLDAIGGLPEGCDVVNADLHDPHLPLDDGQIDAAVASAVLHELNQPVRLLLEMQRCIRPGGYLFVTDWVRSSLDVYMQNEADADKVFSRELDVASLEDTFIHFIEHNRFSRDDLIYMLQRCGFEVMHCDLYNNDRFTRMAARRI
ncbi:MAG: hypothetical protein BMS9Abin26_1785 [Gammaproteobacteria bacterium]|nr:MAG: hypothetical protein BMS9Abin26_1785 [Gammaproteobacteria bacterium]